MVEYDDDRCKAGVDSREEEVGEDKSRGKFVGVSRICSMWLRGGELGLGWVVGLDKDAQVD